jgi:hypothetical protein
MVDKSGFQALLDASLRPYRLIMSKEAYGDILEYSGQVKCILCDKYFSDLQTHCKEIGDKIHLILLVHEA